MSDTILAVDGLRKVFGDGDTATTAIADLTCDVSAGEFLTVVGPSGCGKTTLLRCVAGLEPPTDGTVVFDGTPVTSPPRGLAMVFQDYSRSLMPWLTARQNVAFPLANARVPRRERDAAAISALEAVGVASFADKHPWQLSGGMQQRVAIARALAFRPRVLLMDEPFASVDAQTRSDLEDMMLRLQTEFDVTVVLVTHDIDEAVYLGDRVLVLSRPPTRVEAVLAVELGRDRDQVTTKETTEFMHLRATILRSIKGRGVEAST